LPLVDRFERVSGNHRRALPRPLTARPVGGSYRRPENRVRTGIHDESEPERGAYHRVREDTMRPLTAVLILGLGTLARAASAQVPQPHRLPPTVTTDASDAVMVQNDRKVPVSVYMDFGTFDRRIGVVPALETKSLPLPAWAAKGRLRVQLFVHSDGEPNYLATQPFALQAPARIALLVPPRGGNPTPPDTMMEFIPPDARSDATLTVENDHDRRVTVYARQGLFDVRLGEVAAKSRATLRFPKSVVLPSQSIALFVQPEGGPNRSSPKLEVKRGDHLGLRVPGF
jgi:hypothetical protein